MAKDEPKKAEEEEEEKHPKVAAPDEPKGPFETLFSGADGPIRALVLDVLTPNSTRQYTLEDLSNNTKVPETRLKETLPTLVDLKILGWENPTSGTGRIGYNSQALGDALATFYGRWRTFTELQRNEARSA